MTKQGICPEASSNSKQCKYLFLQLQVSNGADQDAGVCIDFCVVRVLRQQPELRAVKHQ